MLRFLLGSVVLYILIKMSEKPSPTPPPADLKRGSTEQQERGRKTERQIAAEKSIREGNDYPILEEYVRIEDQLRQPGGLKRTFGERLPGGGRYEERKANLEEGLAEIRRALGKDYADPDFLVLEYRRAEGLREAKREERGGKE